MVNGVVPLLDAGWIFAFRAAMSVKGDGSGWNEDGEDAGVRAEHEPTKR